MSRARPITYPTNQFFTSTGNFRSIKSLVIAAIASLAIAAIAYSLFTQDEHVHACSCEHIVSFAEALQLAPILFSGEVVSVQPVEIQLGLSRMLVEFRVDKVWNGPRHETVYAITNRGEESCGYEFRVGKRYIVHAGQTEDYIHTGFCSETSLYSEAQEHLELLGDGADPIAGSTAPIPPHWGYATLTEGGFAEGRTSSGSCNPLADDNRSNIRW